MLSVGEVASRVGVSEQAVRKALKEGRLSGVRGARGWVVDVAAVDRWAQGRGSRSVGKASRSVQSTQTATSRVGTHLPWRESVTAPGKTSSGDAQSVISQLVNVQRQLLDLVEQMSTNGMAEPSGYLREDGNTPPVPTATRWGVTA